MSLNDRWVQPVVLEGVHVRLEPVTMAHVQGLFESCRDPAVWTYLTQRQPSTHAEMADYVADMVSLLSSGSRIAFVIVRRVDGVVLGTTSYFDISAFDEKLEIGYTWLSPNVWRTPINTECKFLLLRHAFEELGCGRVQLKTDARNTRSRNAIERIGAKPEGVLRRFQKRFDGYVRDTAIFSITREEWPEVKVRLQGLMSGQTAETS
ncbi:MAG: GNAT family N-acetyltransferase [Armatimonadetes bacterium]|nr:GNAT family N-acetyltransferase [Armatimonadota bacterium]